MIQIEDHLAMQNVGIGEDFIDVLNFAYRDIGLGKKLEPFVSVFGPENLLEFEAPTLG